MKGKRKGAPQLFPESPEQELQWKQETLDLMFIPMIFDELSWPIVDQEGDLVFFARNGSQWGLIDRAGQWMIKPFLEAIHRNGDFYGSNASFEAKKNGKWGQIDKRGNWIIQPLYDSLLWEAPCLDEENVPDPFWKVCKKGKKGIIDRKGQTVVKPVFDYVKSISFCFRPDDPVRFICEVSGKFGLMDGLGNWIMEPQFDGLRALDTHGVNIAFLKGDKWGLADNMGNLLTEAVFEIICGSHQGLVKVCAGEKEGAFDLKGNLVIKPIFECLDLDFTCGLAKARHGGKWGFIDDKGNWKIKPVFDSACGFFKLGEIFVALVTLDGKEGFIDQNGVFITQESPGGRKGKIRSDASGFGGEEERKKIEIREFDRDGWPIPGEFYERFEKDHFSLLGVQDLQVSGKWGEIDAYGNWATKPVFVQKCPDEEGNNEERFDYGLPLEPLEASDLEDGPLFGERGAWFFPIFPVRVSEKYGFINSGHEWAYKPVFDDVEMDIVGEFPKGEFEYFKVSMNGKWGIIRARYSELALEVDSFKIARAAIEADTGNPEAMFDIGEILEYELCDAEEAMKWYEKAAELGHKGAMINAGIPEPWDLPE